jgi:hypothetical protein
MASRWTGTKSAKRLVKNIPEAMRAELVEALNEGATDLYRAVYSRTPHKTGALQGQLRKRVYPKTLRLRIGFFRGGKNSKAYIARILEFGRKAQTVAIRRGPRAGSQMNVGAIAPKRFVYGPLTDLRREFRVKLKGVWDRVLKQAAGGAGND